LHASLQMEALSQCIDIRAAKETLERFPEKLEDVYLQTWSRINKQPSEHADLAKRILLWILNAERTMSIAELRHALATSPDTFVFSPDRMVPKATLISICCGLVAIDQESGLVRLVRE
jgi:ankyrin repeat domain-containing protein 50